MQELVIKIALVAILDPGTAQKGNRQRYRRGTGDVLAIEAPLTSWYWQTTRMVTDASLEDAPNAYLIQL